MSKVKRLFSRLKKINIAIIFFSPSALNEIRKIKKLQEKEATNE